MTDPIRVLYVDDEAHSLALRKELLERQGNFEVTTSTSASRGLELLEENEYDCLVSDFNMPGTDGIEFLNAVREDYPALPFIIFSGEDTEEAVTAAIDEGATDYLPKSTASISYQLFAHRIRQAVEGTKTSEDTGDDAEPASVADDSNARVDTTPADWRVTDTSITRGFEWLATSELDGDDRHSASIESGFQWLFDAEPAPADESPGWTTLDEFEWISFGALTAAQPDYSVDVADGFAWLTQDDGAVDAAQTTDSEADAPSVSLSTWQAQRVDAAVTTGGFIWLGGHTSDRVEAIPCPVTSCQFRGGTEEAVALHGLQASLDDDTAGLQHRQYDWSVDQLVGSDASGSAGPAEASSPDQATDDAESMAVDAADDPAAPDDDDHDGVAPGETDRPTDEADPVITDLGEVTQDQIESLSTLDLYDLARRLGVPGRGSLSEEELIEAVHESITSVAAGETAHPSSGHASAATPRPAREPLAARLRSTDPRRRADTTPSAEPTAAATTGSQGQESPEPATNTGAQQPVQSNQQPGADDLLAELLRHLADLLSGRSGRHPADPAAGQAPPSEDRPAESDDSPDSSGDDQTDGAVSSSSASASAVTDGSADSDDADGSSLSGDEMEPLFGEDTDEVEDDFSEAVEATDSGSPISTRGVVDDIADIELGPGASVLHLADAHDDERDHVCHHLLGVDEPANRLLIRCTQAGADELERIAAEANEVKIVAIGYDQRVPPHLDDVVETSKVNNATDLTRLGIITTSILDSWEADPNPIYVCFDSISVLLQYKNIQQVFQFLHLLMGKLETADAISHFHLDPESEDPQDVGIFKTLIGTVVDHTDSDLLIKKV